MCYCFYGNSFHMDLHVDFVIKRNQDKSFYPYPYCGRATNAIQVEKQTEWFRRPGCISMHTPLTNTVLEHLSLPVQHYHLGTSWFDFIPLFLCKIKCSRSVRLWGFLLCAALFESVHRAFKGFRSGLGLNHSQNLDLLLLKPVLQWFLCGIVLRLVIAKSRFFFAFGCLTEAGMFRGRYRAPDEEKQSGWCHHYASLWLLCSWGFVLYLLQ